MSKLAPYRREPKYSKRTVVQEILIPREDIMSLLCLYGGATLDFFSALKKMSRDLGLVYPTVEQNSHRLVTSWTKDHFVQKIIT